MIRQRDQRGEPSGAPETPVHGLPRIALAEVLLVCVGYLTLAIAATWPLILNMNTALLGSGDGLQNLWNLWWAEQALSRGQFNLYFTELLYHPQGVSLAYHTLVPFSCLLAYPFLALGAPIGIVYNAITLFTTVASGFGMYLLVRDRTQYRLGAFVAGVIFCFAPIRMSRLMYGNVQIYSTQFIPLMVWCIERARYRPRARRAPHRRYLLGAGLALGLTAWCSLELALGAAILAGLLILFDLLRRGPRWPRLRGWLLMVGVTLLVALPVVWPLLRDAPQFPAEANTLASSERNSADLLGLFVPDYETNPLVRRIAPQPLKAAIDYVHRVSYGNPYEKSVFLGYVVLLTALASVILVRERNAPRREVREWAVVAGIFALLALGPVLRIAGRASVPLPYRLLNALPFLGTGRTPSRLVMFAMLALAVVCGDGLAHLRAKRPRLQWLVLLVGVAVYVEFFAAPVYLDRRAFEVAPHAEFLRDAPEVGAVLNVPLDFYGAEGPAADYMLAQMTHGRPIVGGYISRTPTAVLAPLEQPFVKLLHARLYGDGTSWSFAPEVLEGAMHELHTLDVRYVVLHAAPLSPEDYAVVREVLAGLLARPVYDAADACIWTLD